MQWQLKTAAPAQPWAEPVAVTFEFIFPIPKGTSKIKYHQMLTRQILPDIRPDEDNLAYLITNAMKGIVYDDDKRICEKHVYKYYGLKPLVKITVIPMRPQYGLSDATDL